MTPEEKELTGRFVQGEIDAVTFRSGLRPGLSDATLPALWIGDALAKRDALALELTLAAVSRLPIRFLLENLESVLFETWHFSHETLVRTMADLRDPWAIPSLVKMVHWVPDYLMWNIKGRFLARKAVDGLGWLVDHPSAREELELLAGSKWEVLREAAIRFLSESSGAPRERKDRDQGVVGVKKPHRVVTWERLSDEEEELARRLLYDKMDAETFRNQFLTGLSDDEIAVMLIDEAISKRGDTLLARAIGLLTRLRISFPLRSLEAVLFETWHISHEDLVHMLSARCEPEVIPTLVKMVHWVPDYLMWDTEHRAISRKAVYGLRALSDHPAAREELERIAMSGWESMRETALRFFRQEMDARSAGRSKAFFSVGGSINRFLSQPEWELRAQIFWFGLLLTAAVAGVIYLFS